MKRAACSLILLFGLGTGTMLLAKNKHNNNNNNNCQQTGNNTGNNTGCGGPVGLPEPSAIPELMLLCVVGLSYAGLRRRHANQ
jgi:hypothetical protein